MAKTESPFCDLLPSNHNNTKWHNKNTILRCIDTYKLTRILKDGNNNKLKNNNKNTHTTYTKIEGIKQDYNKVKG